MQIEVCFHITQVRAVETIPVDVTAVLVITSDGDRRDRVVWWVLVLVLKCDISNVTQIIVG